MSAGNFADDRPEPAAVARSSERLAIWRKVLKREETPTVKTPNRTNTGRLLIYTLIVAAIIVVAFRFGPALTAAIGLPILLLIIVCPLMMFFMMRGMSGKPGR